MCILTSGVVGRYRSVFSGCQKGPDDELSRHYRLRHPIVLIEFHQEWLSNLDGQTQALKLSVQTFPQERQQKSHPSLNV